MRNSRTALACLGLLLSLQGCFLLQVTPSPKAVPIQWEAPDFGVLFKAMQICRIPDLEDDGDCAARRHEVQQALDAHAFCVGTKLDLFSCRAILRAAERQREALTACADIAGVAASPVPFVLKAYSPIRNSWLAAEWRWKDRGELIRKDSAGTVTGVVLASLAAGLVALIAGQLQFVRFQSKASKEEDTIRRAHAEAVEAIRIACVQERRWLTLLHLRFLDAGIEQFAFEIDGSSPAGGVWTASNGADHCNREDVTMIDFHRPTGVKLVVTSVRPGRQREGWRFHVFFGTIEDSVRSRKPASLTGIAGAPDWSEHRTFEEIPTARADIAMAVARRFLLQAMRGLEVLSREGAAVPKGWEPYPVEIQQYLKPEQAEDADCL